jgi:hypothetical protein
MAPNTVPRIVRARRDEAVRSSGRAVAGDPSIFILAPRYPQSTSLYETLPILLVARSFREALVFGLLSDAAFIGQRLVMDAPDTTTLQHRQGDVALALLYLPALFVVLRRPNEGEVPVWVGRTWAWLRALPSSRGTP